MVFLGIIQWYQSTDQNSNFSLSVTDNGKLKAVVEYEY